MPKENVEIYTPTIHQPSSTSNRHKTGPIGSDEDVHQDRRLSQIRRDNNVQRRNVSKTPRYRNCCFTQNNPPLEITENPDRLWENLEGKANYLCFQFERGETGTLHIQGYIEFKKKVCFSTITRKLLIGAHIENRRGSQQQAIDYCKKPESRVKGPFEFGTKSQQGNRTDVHEFVDAVRAGGSDEYMITNYTLTWMKYQKAAGRIRQACFKPKTRLELEVVLLFGDPGTGKTREVYAASNDLYVVPITSGPLWFDNYNGEKTLLIDDFTGQMKLDNLLRLLDIYPMQLPVKGAHTWLQATKIYITSNSHFSTWYTFMDRPLKLAALARRIHQTKKFVMKDNKEVLITDYVY